MVKSEATARKRMERNIVGAGATLQEGMEEGENPVEKILSDPAFYIGKQVAGVAAAAKSGKTQGGLEKARARDSWTKAISRAGTNYEARAADMVDHAMEDYGDRAKVIEAVQKATEKMPTATRDQRIAKSAAYQKLVGEGFDKLYGRK